MTLFVAELPGRLVVTDIDKIRDHFHIARMTASQRALWCADDPGAPLDTCRFCGKHWRRWAGSTLDGHAKCIVGEDFKTWLRDLMRDPTLTYSKVSAAIGVSVSVVRSWVMPIAEARR